MEDFSLVKDFALIMIVAGAATLLFRRLHQPPILGYLIAGLIIGPYVLPVISVTDIHTIRLLADLGLVVLLFGIGLEFSWSKIREMGLAVIIIGVVEILTMFLLGYGLGRVLGWSPMNSLFLGAALHISSSAIITKILRDLGKLSLPSSRLIIGILVVEDFAAVIIITVLSGLATTGTADLGDIGFLVLKLVIFILASLMFGAIIVPRIVRFTHQFHSKEVLLITGLGMCFGMALLGNYLGLSVAAGAFLIGSLIGDTERSGEFIEVVTPVRDMFAALFFVTIGMLIDVSQFREFIAPAIIICAVFMAGKILSNTLATFFSGHDGKTALQVGMGMPQMGEFSLAITKVGADKGVLVPQLYPSIAVATALSTFISPYMTRSADSVARILNLRSPALIKTYILRLSDWLQVMRSTMARDTKVAKRVQGDVETIMINLLIVVVILGVGTFTVQFVKDIARLTHIRADIVGLLFGFVFLMLCVPAIVIIWRNVRKLIDLAVTYILVRRSSAKEWRRESLRIVLRNTIAIVLVIFFALWSIPLIVQLLAFGSFSLAVPLLFLATLLFFILGSVTQIHGQLEQTLSKVILGKELASSRDVALRAPMAIRQGALRKLINFVELPIVTILRWCRVNFNKSAVSNKKRKDEDNSSL
jgi:CPA2 family monovalent cation:H+ antiporter-2